MRTITGLAVLLILFSTTHLAQQKVASLPSLSDAASRGPFVSEKSGFAISLPQKPTSITEIKNPRAKSGGRGTRFTWELKEGKVTVDHNIYREPVISAGGHMDDYAESFRDEINALTGGRAKLIRENRVGMLGISGVAFEYSTGSALIVAHAYTRENEEFIIVGTALPTAPASERLMRDAAGTFRLNKGLATVNGVTYALPAGVKDPYTLLSMHKDRKDENLKGMVKRVIVEEEAALDDPPGRIRRSERYYDSFGNRTSEMLYSTDGTPAGRRDFKNDYLTNQRTAIFSGPGDSAGAENEREEYRYRHDEQGRTIEEKIQTLDGKRAWRAAFSYGDDQVTVSRFRKDGRPIETETLNIGKDGEPVTSRLQITGPGLPARSLKRTYKYESFDDRGNWTRRTVTHDDGVVRIEYRTIEYY